MIINFLPARETRTHNLECSPAEMDVQVALMELSKSLRKFGATANLEKNTKTYVTICYMVRVCYKIKLNCTGIFLFW
jgi:hypothetical protein